MLATALGLIASATAAAPAADPGGAAPGEAPADTTPARPAPAPRGPQPLPIRSATLRQDGGALVLTVTAARAWTAPALAERRQALCLRLVYRPGADFASRDLCVVRRPGKVRLNYYRVLRSGGHGPAHSLPGRVRRPDRHSLVARFDPTKLKIPYGELRWRLLSTTDGCRIAAGARCFVAVPADGALLTLRAPLPASCSVPGPAYVTNGPRDRRVVALTFDDGPGPLTGAVLDVLARERARATFFLIGQQVAGGAALVRRMLADGHMVAGHSWSHANLSGGGALASSQISATANAIQRASGFRPCLFRAPYGAISQGLIGAARGLGATTIQWDVDTNDWQLPGSTTIAARALRARSGSIVLMHDAGGPRAQTLAALPQIIRGLRARGYRFVTVTELLGATVRYR